ncbi:BQ5605_C018g08731 [Microbotryum silenes-dioicae]|uniref:BQ5605_C018g08731 protein n=1 Tax=Microbotryum silenes-dioicae TaxID=796604 RepID=A0A2X0NUN5_9BASI|nr:BQ5605_C018g08731 [Microbotryum silenes-dioicae]
MTSPNKAPFDSTTRAASHYTTSHGLQTSGVATSLPAARTSQSSDIPSSRVNTTPKRTSSVTFTPPLLDEPAQVLQRGPRTVETDSNDGASHFGSAGADVRLNALTEKATHDVRILQTVIHDHKHHHETEYVTRLRDLHIHHHHIQHHVQPLVDDTSSKEQHHYQSMPVQEKFEQRTNSPNDLELWALLNKQRHTETQTCHERIVIQNGEQVHETVHYHVHNIIQPVFYRYRPVPSVCTNPNVVR